MADAADPSNRPTERRQHRRCRSKNYFRARIDAIGAADRYRESSWSQRYAETADSPEHRQALLEGRKPAIATGATAHITGSIIARSARVNLPRFGLFVPKTRKLCSHQVELEMTLFSRLLGTSPLAENVLVARDNRTTMISRLLCEGGAGAVRLYADHHHSCIRAGDL